MMGFVAIIVIITAALSTGVAAGVKKTMAKDDIAKKKGYYSDPDHPNIKRDYETDRIVRVDTNADGFTTIVDRDSMQIKATPTFDEWYENKQKAEEEKDERFSTYCTLKVEPPYKGCPGGFSFSQMGVGSGTWNREKLWFRTFWGYDFYIDQNGQLVSFTDDMNLEMDKKGRDDYVNEFGISRLEIEDMMAKYNLRTKLKSKDVPQRFVDEVNSGPRGRHSATGGLPDKAKYVTKKYHHWFYAAHPWTVMNWRDEQLRCICREKEYQAGRFSNFENYEYQNPKEMPSIVNVFGKRIF